MADKLTPTDFPQGELLFYTSKDGKVKMEIRVEEETIWMSQQMMAELFQTTKQNIAKHHQLYILTKKTFFRTHAHKYELFCMNA